MCVCVCVCVCLCVCVCERDSICYLRMLILIHFEALTCHLRLTNAYYFRCEIESF